MEGKTMKCLICGNTIEGYVENEPRICIEHWKCPKCSVGTEYMDEYGDEVEGLMLEDVNYINCMKCETTWTAKKLENAIMKKHTMVKCPFCKGQGTVQATKAAKFKEHK